MIVVPYAHDQPDNAFRVTNLGVARTLYPQRYKADRIRRELEQLLGDRTYAERAEAIAKTVRSEGGAEEAAAILDRLIARPAASLV